MYHLEIPLSKMFWNVLKILTLALLEFWYFESEVVKILNIENIEYKKLTDFTFLVLFSKKKLSEISIILPSQFIGNSYLEPLCQISKILKHVRNLNYYIKFQYMFIGTFF